MSKRTNYNRQYRRPRAYCNRCNLHGHSETSHPCAFCLETHQSRHHLCPICDRTGHDKQYHKCRFCPEFHGSTNHICELCQEKGHSQNQHCSFCRELHNWTCSTCGVPGHCSKQEHCSICSDYHDDAEHVCSICSLLGHEASLDCIPHLAETNKNLETRVSDLETTIETLLNKLRNLSHN